MPDSLARARALTRLLDTAARIPGTGIRFGLDPILGLVPGLGDLAGAALSGYLVLLAGRSGASRTTIVRMLGNVAIDTFGGMLPVLGDAFDVAFKSNSRNLVLLERPRAVAVDGSRRAGGWTDGDLGSAAGDGAARGGGDRGGVFRGHRDRARVAAAVGRHAPPHRRSGAGAEQAPPYEGTTASE
jgi:hypothetical protein